MIYIKFPNYEVVPIITASQTVLGMRAWLIEHAGPEADSDNKTDIDGAWKWNRGDRYARGVYIRDPQLATIFKLRFQL